MAKPPVPGERRLEGLVLRGADGALYEVPCAVIERYRVADERGTMLGRTQAGASHDGAPCRGYHTVSWTVCGGIYTP